MRLIKVFLTTKGKNDRLNEVLNQKLTTSVAIKKFLPISHFRKGLIKTSVLT